MPKKTSEEDARKIMEVAGFLPLEPYRNNSTPWKSKCVICKQIVSPTLKNVQNNHKCAYCANRRVKPQEAIKLMLQFNLQPLEPYINANSKWMSQCLNCGKIVYPRYGDIKQGKGGCYKCGIQNRNYPHKYTREEAKAIMLDVDLLPLEPYKNSVSKWKCQCLKCGKIVTPMLGTVVDEKSGCRFCARIKAGEKKRIKPEIAKQTMIDAGFIPETAYVGKQNKWKSKCIKCGKVSFPSLSNVMSRNSRCIYCAKGKVDELDAIKVMRESSLEPLEPYAGNKTKWKSKCLKCGEIVFPKYNGIQNGRGGCTNCAPKGMNLTAPSYLYLITNSELNAHKIGIANIQEKKYKDRLHKFKLKGWKVHKVWTMESGYLASKIESNVFNVLRNELKLPVYLSKKDMPVTGGETETVDGDSISLLELEKLIKKALKPS